MKTLKIFLVLLIVPGVLIATTEQHYQDQHCEGVKEYVLSDRTRVDCLTETHAIEYDFARKWAEAIGQALRYAFETNKKAGIVLILESKKDYRYWIKMNSIINYYRLPNRHMEG